MIVEDHAADSRVQELAIECDGRGVRHVLIVIRGGEVNHLAGVAQTDRSEKFDVAGFEREHDFLRRAEGAAFAFRAGLGLGQVIDAEDHVLRRNGERHAVRGRKNVVRAEHQHRRFHLSFG